MRDYVIMTDSCCDLPAWMADELGLVVLPLSFLLGGKEYANYLDGREMSPEVFYQHVRAGETSTTAAVSVGAFEDAMRPLLAAGKDILSINFSSALSTTYQSACIAAEGLREEFPEAKIFVVDSLSASLGQGLLLYLCAQEKKKGLTVEELRDYTEKTKLSVCHWFTVDDLNHLKRGGRISATTALVGTMLSIKPVMHTSDEGKLVPVSKARGRKAALAALLEHLENTAIDPASQVMFICHSDCADEANAVAEKIKSSYGAKDVYVNFIGPVIGNHTGPNTIGIFFVGTER